MILAQLNQIESGAHYILIYGDLITFRQIYSYYTKIQLEENNELVLLLPYYETTDTVRCHLRENEHACIDVRKYEKEGSLAIIYSVRAYFCSTSIMTFVERLVKHVKHAEKLGKDSVTGIADMGAFFQFNNSKNKKASVMKTMKTLYHQNFIQN